MNKISTFKNRKIISHYLDECAPGINLVFSRLLDQILLRALKSIQKGKEFYGRPISKENVQLNENQYEEVKQIIELLKNHDKGIYSDIIGYIIPNNDENENKDGEDEKKKDIQNKVLTNQNTNSDLLKFLGFELNNMEETTRNNNEFYDPFGNSSDLSKVFGHINKSKTKSKTKSKAKSKTKSKLRSKSSGNIGIFDPYNAKYQSKNRTLKSRSSKRHASKLKSPSMKSMRNDMGIPNGS